jgi:hypothetical protein
MAPNKMIPIRGIKEDYYGDQELSQLEKKKTYAKEVRNQLLGSPDFEKYEDFLLTPSSKK